MSKKERAAAQFRIMQTHMMVAALSCQQQGSYNRFVRQFKPVLQDSSNNLRQYFSRVYGAQAEKNLNSFVTKISNIESSASLKNGEGNYCKNAAEKFRLVLEMRPADLSAYAQRNFRQNLPEENLCAY
jgi:hypothetical protein